jgi:conserved repeat domain
MSYLSLYNHPEVAATTVSNTANVTSDALPSPGLDATATFTVQSTQLTISKTVDKNGAKSGDPIIYTITVTNTSPDTSETNVTVTDQLPPEVIFPTQSTDIGFSITQVPPPTSSRSIDIDGLVTVEVTQLNAGESFTVTIPCTVA